MLAFVVAAVGACGTGPAAEPDAGESPGVWVRGEEPWRGLLLNVYAAEPGVVEVDGVPEIPKAAGAYQVVAPTADDLERLAELYAGGPVERGVMPGASPDVIGFDTGDGWFQGAEEYLTDDYVDLSGDGWSWTQRRWRENPPTAPGSEDFVPCPAGTRVPDSVVPFFSRLQLDVAPSGRIDCSGGLVTVRLDVLLDGLRVNGVDEQASVDQSGEVVSASAPFMLFESLGEVELAPVPALLRRLVTGFGVIPGNPPCAQPCTYSTQRATLSLELVRTGGIGAHDHVPGNVVPGVLTQVAVPALSAPAVTPPPYGTAASFLSAVALSSALLVDDPAQADSARAVDDGMAVPAGGEQTSACAGLGETLIVCTSSFLVSLGEPVLLTVGGELHAPVGADACAPVLTLDLGDGTVRTPPPPRVGTLVSARTVHVYDSPGTFTVTAHRASRCVEVDSGGLLEPEYDETTHVTITVE